MGIRTLGITSIRQLQSILMSIKASLLQLIHMYSPLYLLYPFNYFLPNLETLPSIHAYPSLINPIKEQTSEEIPEPLPEACAQVSTQREVEIKLEEPVIKTRPKRTKNEHSRFRYPKKNVESNVVNQCYSFMTTRSKSLKLVSKLLGSQQRTNVFYQIMKQGRKKQTKYMGRAVLQSLQQLEDDHPVYILHKKLRCKVSLKINQLRQVLRILINYFLKNLIVPSILTSSKMDRTTVTQHLTRSREILAYLNESPCPL